MRRATAVVLGTLTGTALMVGAKVGTTPVADDATAVDPGAVVVGGGDPAAPGVTASGGRTTAPGHSPTPGPSHAPSRSPSAGATPTPTSTRPGTTPKPTKTTPPPSSGLKDGTYTANAQVRNGRFGTLSMTVTIAGGKIGAISASESGGETNCYRNACNTLKPEALAAQSANVASVSGATYTSSAFKAALGAVLSSAKS